MLKQKKIRIPDGIQTKLNHLIQLTNIDNPIIGNESDKKGMKRKMTALIKTNLKKFHGNYEHVTRLLMQLISIEKNRLEFTKLLNKFTEYKDFITYNVPMNHQARLLSGVWTNTLSYAFSAGEEAAVELLDKIIEKNKLTITELADKTEEE